MKRIVLVASLLVLAISIVLGVVAWGRVFGLNESEANQTVREAERLGLPVTWQAFLALQPTGTDDSSTDYRRIAATKPNIGIKRWKRQMLSATAAELSALLPNAEAMRLCEGAARHKDFAPQRDWAGDPFSVIFPEYSAMRSVAQIFATRAVYKAKTGNAVEAMEDMNLIRNVARHAGSEHFIISGLVKIGCDHIWFEAAEQIARANVHNEAVLAALENDAASLVGPDFRNALKSEFASGRREFDLITMGKIAPRRTAFGNAIAKLLAAKSKARFTRRMVNVTAVWGNWPKVEALQESWNTSNDELVADFGNELLTNFSGVILAIKRNEALVATARIALSAQLSKNRTGIWPTLESAAAKANVSPIDPFTGKRFAYKTSVSGITVYSLGQNGIDDGGNESGKNRDQAVFVIAPFGQ